MIIVINATFFTVDDTDKDYLGYLIVCFKDYIRVYRTFSADNDMEYVCKFTKDCQLEKIIEFIGINTDDGAIF